MSQKPPKYVPSEELEKAFSILKIDMMRRPDSTFYTTIFFNLDHVWDTTIERIQIHGTTIHYNPDFFMQLPRDVRMTTMMQATLHVALMHPERMVGRNAQKWNQACDIVVNEQLKARDYKLDDEMPQNEAFREMSAEEIYSRLPDPPEDPNGEGGGAGGGNGWDDLNEPGSAQEAAEFKDKVQSMVIQAAQASKMAGDKPGSIPGEIELFLDKLNNPKLPYNVLLKRYFKDTAKTDYSMQRPNKRFMQSGMYLPGMKSDALVNIAVGVDISGSVSDSDFQQFVSDTHSVMKTFKPKKIDFIQFDTKIQHHDVLRSLGDFKKLSFTGRGGTCPRELLEWAIINKPKVLLIYTDGEFYTENLPNYTGNVLWLIHNNPSFKAPMGDVIHYELPSNY